ncbi:MAG: FHA domain-containing protein [Archangiaceae bacterium]|nr:FHA domain-containing protein [Archangiaceae bacterium]
MKTLLLSALTRQFLIQGARFAQAHPNDWLMWEAGALSVPRGNIATANTVSQGLDARADRPSVGDPLCFALPPTSEGVTVTIGRSEGNDLVLSDDAVSRHHCTLVFTGGGWTVTSAAEGHSLELEGAQVPFGQWHTVSSGQKLGLGHLALTLFTSHGMLLRLAQKLARR